MDNMTPDWQLMDDIIKSNSIMLEKQYACDVTFLVGRDETPYGAHKFVLISRSPVFDAMFCGSLKGDNCSQVSLPDMEMDAFQVFLRYLYCGMAEMTADNVIPLLYTAKKYSVIGLVNKCISFVENQLDSENACAVLEQAHFFDETEFYQKVLTVILRKADEVLETKDISQLCEKCLTTIVQSDNLLCKEELVLDACTRWAESECERRGLGVTDANCRIMLGSALYQIRFPLLEPAVFVKRVASGSLLTEEEKVDVMGRYILTCRPSVYFPTSLRTKQRQFRFNRFQSQSEMAFNNRSGSSAITFEVNQDIYIEGFTVYGTCRSGDQELQVSGRIVDNALENTICSVEKSVVTSGNESVYDVIFDSSTCLHQGCPYTLIVDIAGTHTFAGQGGRPVVLCKDVVFTFSPSEKCLTGTTVSHGQLPGLIFSQ